MTENRLNLAFPEVIYRNIVLKDDSLCFTAVELVANDDPLKYEIIEVSITKIEALQVEIIPFKDGDYGLSSSPIDFGNANEKDEGFEGIMYENPFSEVKGEFYWISSNFRAGNVKTERTGKFEYKTRP